jgi:UDP-N-acetylmuramoyl-tripeptide--D-alanyl-D-alanine ligase
MIENSASFKYEDLVSLFGHNNLLNIDENFTNNRVITDSREVKQGDIFIALVGERIDAHSKVYEAHQNGAVAIVVNISWYLAEKSINLDKIANLPLILIDNSLAALGLLAHKHRMKFNIPVVAVAGSNGKTTTKEMITAVLSKKYNVLSTYKNFNNQIGVPLMLLSMNETHQAAVIEIATNSHGEIFTLANILAPKYGVITNIGKEHLEILEDLDGVEMEETSLFAYIRKHLGYAFINADDDRLLKYAGLFENKMVYGTNSVSELLATIKFDENLYANIKLDHSGSNYEYNLNVVGLGNAYASIVAFGIGYRLDIEIADIIAALEGFTVDESSNYGRMRIENYKLANSFDKLTIINDCYNANPSSMELALNTVASVKSNYSQTICVLGEMLELGAAGFEEHIELIKNAVKQGDLVYLYGNEFVNSFNSINDNDELSASDLAKIIYFDDKVDLTNSLIETLSIPLTKNTDNSNNGIEYIGRRLLLVKGSRGNRLEEVINYLKESNLIS